MPSKGETSPGNKAVQQRHDGYNEKSKAGPAENDFVRVVLVRTEDDGARRRGWRNPREEGANRRCPK
jgi:hypothetical protein